MKTKLKPCKGCSQPKKIWSDGLCLTCDKRTNPDKYRMKKEKKPKKKKRIKLPSIPKLKKKAQEVFNAWIRKRDSKDGYFVCISCNETKRTDQMNAGHYYAVKGYDSMRYDEDNCHGECVGDNCFNESHLIGYGINLEKRIGTERLQALHEKAAESKRTVHKWTRSELMEIIEKYSI